MKAQITVWGIKNKDGMLFWSSVGFSISRRGAIRLFMEKCLSPSTWKQCYRRGFRAVPVRITEIKP